MIKVPYRSRETDAFSRAANERTNTGRFETGPLSSDWGGPLWGKIQLLGSEKSGTFQSARMGALPQINGGSASVVALLQCRPAHCVPGSQATLSLIGSLQLFTNDNQSQTPFNPHSFQCRSFCQCFLLRART